MNTSPGPVRVFLDANILAKPVTRTLLIAGGPASNFVAVWSPTALDQADRHLGPGKTPVWHLVTRFGWAVGPTGDHADRYVGTDPADRQILADAVAAEAAFLVTEDVDDFAEIDLATVGMSAVAPDLFLAHRLTAARYLEAVDALVANRTRPPSAPSAIHQALGRQHPMLVDAHREQFDAEPAPATQRPPAVVIRGARCLRCTTTIQAPTRLVGGRCLDCEERHHRTDT